MTESIDPTPPDTTPLNRARYDAYLATVEQFQAWCADRGHSYQWAASRALRAFMATYVESTDAPTPDASSRSRGRRGRKARPVCVEGFEHPFPTALSAAKALGITSGALWYILNRGGRCKGRAVRYAEGGPA